MRRARYLAPWHREAVDFDELEGTDGRDGEVVELLAGLRGKPAIYHCVSRVVNREFVLKREEKERFVGLMRVYERFCQVQVLTFCVMSNHFHILVEVPAAPEDEGASWTDEELLEHLSCLYSEREMAELRWELDYYREKKMDGAAEAFRQKFFDRMWDLSAFMKVLKQRFTQWFNKKYGRDGYLWSGRFKSVLVEDGHAARTVAAYIDLNPVRAGMVEDPKDYRWSGYGEAVAGKGAARNGLRLVLFDPASQGYAGTGNADGSPSSPSYNRTQVASWREVVRQYRVVLFEDGEERSGDGSERRRGFSPKEVARVLKCGGRLSEAQMLRSRVRYFLDGLVIGSESFVNRAFLLSRGFFGAARRSGARKMWRIDSTLRTMRDLKKDPVGVK